MLLSEAQYNTLNDMKNAPLYDGSQQWCDTYVRCDGIINGNWNTNTLKALERKGVITIIKVGDWWNDEVKLNNF